MTVCNGTTQPPSVNDRPPITFPLKPDLTPAIKGWNKLTEPHAHEDGAPFGVLTGATPGIFVLDLDRKKSKDGVAEIAKLGPPLPPTLSVRTKSGGIHLYFNHPGWPVPTNQSKLAPGIDIKGDVNGFAVGPGSIAEDGGVYEIEDDLPIADAPEWLLEAIRKTATLPSTASDEPRAPSAEATEVLLGEAKCRLLAWPAVTEPNDGQTEEFLTGCAGRLSSDLNLPPEASYQLIEETFAPRCHDGWWDREHQKQVQRVLERFRPNAEPAIGVDAAVAAGDNWMEELDLDAPVPPTEWLIENVIEEETIHAFVAHPGSMKTWTLYSIALAVSQGHKWLGRFQAKKTNVLLLDFETGRKRALRRFQKLKQQLRGIKGIFFKRGEPGSLHSEETWTKLVEEAQRAGVGLVLVDSLSGGSGVEDENDTRFANPLKVAARVSDDTGITFIFIHHAKKGDSKDSEIMRGTSALQAACDSIHRFTEPVGDQRIGLKCKMKVAKAGDGDQDPFIGLRLLPDPGGLTLDDLVAAAPVETSDTKTIDEKVYKQILEAGERGAPGVKNLAAEMTMRKQFVSDAVGRLIEQHRVRKVGHALFAGPWAAGG